MILMGAFLWHEEAARPKPWLEQEQTVTNELFSQMFSREIKNTHKIL